MKRKLRSLTTAIIAFCALPALAATPPTPPTAADAAAQAAKVKDEPTLKDRLLNVSVGTYGTVNWSKIAGRATAGVGLYLQSDLAKNVALRLRGEADSWHPDDYLVDRIWADVVVRAPLSASSEIYGFGGFGYSPGREKTVRVYSEGNKEFSRREGEDLLAHAGGGLAWKIAGDEQHFHVKAFGEGSLFASTGEQRGAGVAGGLHVGF